MDGDAALREVGMGSAAIIAGFAAGSVLQYLVKVVLARFLGPASYGVFVQGLALVQAAAIVALLGLHRSLPRFLSYYRGTGEETRSEEAAATALSIVVPSSLLVSAALYLSAEWLALTVFQEPALVLPLELFSLSVLPLSLFFLAVGFIRGMQNARYKVYLDDLLFPGLNLVLVLAFFALGYGLTGAVYAYLSAAVVVAIASYVLYGRLSDIRPPGSSALARNLLAFSWPLFIISLLVISIKWVDVLMMGWLKESAAVGVYEVALAVAGLLPLFLSALNYMFLPVTSELYGRDELSHILDIYRTSTRWVLTLVLPIVAGMLLFPAEILHVLFGASYTAGAIPLMVLAVGYLFHVSVGPAGMVLLSTGRTKRMMAGMAVLAGVDVALNLVLIPAYGMTGAAVAMTVGLLAGNAVLLFFAGREVGGFPYTRRYVNPLVGAVVASLLTYAVNMVWNPGPPGSVLLGVFLVAVYAAFLYLSASIPEEDREVVSAVVRSVGS